MDSDNENNDMKGRVELCIDKTWSTVNNRQWTNIESRVVCDQLGYSNEGKLSIMLIYYTCTCIKRFVC